LRPCCGNDGIDKDIADRGAGLIGDPAAAQLFDFADVQVLARGDARRLADMFDHRDRDQPALGIADDERLTGIGAEIDLARHHLLHGEIAGRHREFLDRDAVLVEIARLQQIVRRHAPDIGLIALADGRGGGRRRPCRRAERQRADAARGQLASGQHRRVFAPLLCHLPPASFFLFICSIPARCARDLRFCVRFVVGFLA
jgi:hypothetical protein